MIGSKVTVKIDRPLGSYHPKHKDIYYPINYGYIEGIMAPDGEEQDVYILGVDEPVEEFTGVVIAIIHRYDDVEEKWVIAPENMTFSREEIEKQVHFQEQYFKSEIRMLQVTSKIKSLIANKPYTVDDVGMSGNQVLIFDDMVLKIEDDPVSVRKQVQIMRWLEGKISVPRVLEYEEENGKCYLLMSRIGGKMSCAEYYLEHPDILLKALVEGLQTLWKVDVSECPVVRDLDVVLKEARFNVDNNLVDIDNVEPETFGENGFESPRHLLEWLESNRPIFEPVFSHGDYCLPNIFLEDGRINGFIDLGRAGVGDKWNDIALCYRSIRDNFSGRYGGKRYEDFNPDKLFEVLGIEPDWEKIRYYLLVDELF